jgi:hypothetical protein
MTRAEHTVTLAGHIVAAWAVFSWPLEFGLWYGLTYLPDSVMSWVGASHEPVPAIIGIAFLFPSVVGMLGGVTVAVAGSVKRCQPAVFEGLIALASGVILFLYSGWALAMMHVQ